MSAKQLVAFLLYFLFVLYWFLLSTICFDFLLLTEVYKICLFARNCRFMKDPFSNLLNYHYNYHKHLENNLLILSVAFQNWSLWLVQFYLETLIYQFALILTFVESSMNAFHTFSLRICFSDVKLSVHPSNSMNELDLFRLRLKQSSSLGNNFITKAVH